MDNINNIEPISPEEFSERAQIIVDSCQGDARIMNGWGHQAMDCLLEDVLWSLGYGERLMVFDKLRHIMY